MLSIAVEWGWLQQNPAVGRFRLPERVSKRPRIVLWPEQFWALVGHLRQPYQTIVILAVLGGLRRGELAALRWGDNRQPGKILVDEAVYWGNADEENNLPYWRLGTPKTPKSRREVAIGPIAQRAIDEWRSARWASKNRPMVRFAGPNDYMFAIRKNTPIDLHSAVERHLEPAAIKAGVPPVSWHDLRHTYTTWGRLAGMKPEIMRDQLGHASVLMTLDVYSHVNQSEERVGDVAKVEQYASEKPKAPAPEPAAKSGKVLVFQRKVG
jgi:integrase